MATELRKRLTPIDEAADRGPSGAGSQRRATRRVRVVEDRLPQRLPIGAGPRASRPRTLAVAGEAAAALADRPPVVAPGLHDVDLLTQVAAHVADEELVPSAAVKREPERVA